MARLGLAAFLVSIAVLGAACGGETGKEPLSPVEERAYGSGADRVWVFRPDDRKPRAVVIFFHGLGDVAETTPHYHRPWLRHLAAMGNAVLYPRFEVRPGAPAALKHALAGIEQAVSRLGADLPAVAIGYSRGGGLAVDYAAVAQAVGVVPSAVLGVFPAMLDPPLDLRAIRPGTRFVFLVGDRDAVVGRFGADRLIDALAGAGYPSGLVKEEVVRSRPGFEATHLSVLETTPGARQAFWARADRLIVGVVGRAAGT